MPKLYVGVEGLKIKVDVGDDRDITQASNTKILAKKPDGSEVEFQAEVEEVHYLTYLTTAEDIDQAGDWKFQSWLKLNQWEGPGETKIIRFHERFK